jgi:hypothetical protein
MDSDEVAHGESAALLAIIGAMAVRLQRAGVLDVSEMCDALRAASGNHRSEHPFGGALRRMTNALEEFARSAPERPEFSVIDGGKPETD